MKFTVLGASGFVGSHVAARARELGHEVFCPGRDVALHGLNLGHVVYSIGITADFRRRPHDTVTAHVTKLQSVLTECRFDSLVYLSSTRVYARCQFDSAIVGTATEDTPTPVLSTDPSDLYNLSKLMGESLALTHGPTVKVARLSNVVGPDFESENFLISLLRDCVRTGHVTLRQALDSQKDYVSVLDVAEVLLRLGPEGTHPVYNVASGRQTAHHEVLDELRRLTGATWSVAEAAPTVSFPPIDTRRLREELGFAPAAVLAMLPRLVDEFRKTVR